MPSQYSTIDENGTGGDKRIVRSASDDDDDNISRNSSRVSLPSFTRKQRLPASMSEPLNTSSIQYSDESRKTTDPGDPFYVFRKDLYRKLELVDEALAEFLRVVHQTDTSVNVHELKDAKKQLKRQIKNAESVLGDVSSTVDVVERDREKFSRIDSAELYERKAFVNTSHDRLQKAKEELNSESVKTKVLADERSKAIRRADGMMGAENEGERENTEFIVNSQARASVLMRQQDETLDELNVAVTRVGAMAGNIHEEIGAQNQMLDEMDEDLVNAEEQLGIVMGKLGKLLKTKDKCQLGLIMCLTATVIFLFLLVIYT